MVNLLYLIIFISWLIFLILKIKKIKVIFNIKKNANAIFIVMLNIIILFFFPMACFKIFDFSLGSKVEIDSYSYSVLAFFVLFISVIIRFIVSILYSILCIFKNNIIYKLTNIYNIYLIIFLPIIDYFFYKHILSYIYIYNFTQNTFLYYMLLFSFTLIYLPFFIVISTKKIIHFIVK